MISARFGLLLGFVFVFAFGSAGKLSAEPGGSHHNVAGIGIVAGADVPLDGSSEGPRLRDHLVVVRVLDKGPAQKLKLKAGDEIVEIDGVRLAGKHFIDAVNNLLRGPLGSVVKITVVRAGAPPHIYEIVRDIVPVSS